jgi:hypothetical protein
MRWFGKVGERTEWRSVGKYGDRLSSYLDPRAWSVNETAKCRIVWNSIEHLLDRKDLGVNETA